MVATTKWGDRQARRRDILKAATALLERQGYAHLSMRDVAQGAGVSLGTLYTYFAGKEALFAALYAERLERFHTEIAPICATATSPEELFVAVAGHYLDVYRVFGRELNVWALLLDAADESGAPPEQVAQPLIQATAAVMATIQTAFVRLTADGRLHLAAPADAGLILPLLWATLQGLADHFTGARHQMHPYTWHELTAFAARTLVAGLTTAGSTGSTDSVPTLESDHCT